MVKAKWITNVKYTTKEESYEYYKENGLNPEEYDISEFDEVEISVVREDNDDGIESYGCEDSNKIILFDESQEYDKEDIEWCKQVAEAMCESLNEKGL